MNCSRSTLLISLLLALLICTTAFADYQIKSDDIRVDASQFANNLSLNATDVQKALEEIDELGVEGPQGPAGSDGVAGPNLVGSTTASDLTGILKGTGTNVTTAEAGVDYVAGTPWQSEGYLTDAPSDGSQYLRLNGAWSTVTIPAGTINRTISIAFDGCGAVPTAGTTAIHADMGYSGTITGWSLSSVSDSGAAVTASAVFTVKKNGSAISGTEKPTLSSASSNSDTSLTTWTTSFVKGDKITASVDSASTGTRYALSIYAEATT